MSTQRLRLDAFLSRSGRGSRSEARKLIRSGAVTVAGEVVRDQACIVGRDAAVRIGGDPVQLPPERVDLLVHKPVGLSCSHDEREAPLLEEIYPPDYTPLAIEPAGRLDRATSGLLVCSTDGSFIHRLIHPKQKVPKRYRILYTGTLSGQAVERCAAGMTLPDDPKPLAPARLTIHQADAAGGQATLIITEGRYHQVRRMIAALGGEVVGLHRDRIGALELPDDLPPGGTRELGEAERALLFVTDPD
jgi:16S rRNA pseudouridine516 synthase